MIGRQPRGHYLHATLSAIDLLYVVPMIPNRITPASMTTV
jgi:hypothetical protein